jgi:phage baseplate assembly protein W
MTARASVLRPLSWPLLASPDAHGRLAFPSLEDSVRQMIRVILLTRPGEQLMRPQFGAGLARFVDQPNTTDTRRRLREVILESLERWEQRIFVEEVAVEEIVDQATSVRVDIAFQLRRTGLRSQVGLTMTLGG